MMEAVAPLFFPISEVADELQVPQHVLRSWESRCEDIVGETRGGRRYYQSGDIDQFRKIAGLVYQGGLSPEEAIARVRGGEELSVDVQEVEETLSSVSSDIDVPVEAVVQLEIVSEAVSSCEAAWRAQTIAALEEMQADIRSLRSILPVG